MCELCVCCVCCVLCVLCVCAVYVMCVLCELCVGQKSPHPAHLLSLCLHTATCPYLLHSNWSQYTTIQVLPTIGGGLFCTAVLESTLQFDGEGLLVLVLQWSEVDKSRVWPGSWPLIGWRPSPPWDPKLFLSGSSALSLSPQSLSPPPPPKTSLRNRRGLIWHTPDWVNLNPIFDARRRVERNLLMKWVKELSLCK